MKTLCAVIFNFLWVAILISLPQFSIAQTDHEKHHPKPQTSTSMTPGADLSDSSKGMAGGKVEGMGGEMGEMMKEMMSQMGKAPAKGLYPSLMQLPDLSPEKTDEIKQLANAQIVEGNALMNIGLRKLSAATQRQDRDAMLEATEQIQRGQILLESGLEGQRALAENKDPRVTALQWFNRQMNLPSSPEIQPHGFLGLSWFHYITMLMLAAFSAVMIWMYFHKMQRANALILKLTGDSVDKILPTGDSKPITGKSEAAPKSVVVKPVPSAKSNPPVKGEVVAGTDMPPSKPNSFKGILLVSEIFDETPNVKTFRLLDPSGGKLPFNYLPGQFISLTVIPNGVPINRSYTIASSPTHRDYCEITVKHEERPGVSHYLHSHVHEGELLQVTAPSGKFTFTESDADCIVFIAGGVGVTPFMSSIRYLTDRSWKKNIYLLFTCKNEIGIIFHEELGYLQKRHPNLHVFYVLTRPEKTNEPYASGRITKEIITNFVPDIATRRIHICGPEPMMDAVKQMLNELKVPKENVKLELFASNPDAPPPSSKGASTPKEPEAAKDEVAQSTSTEEVTKSDTNPVPSEETAALTPVPEENDNAPPLVNSESSGTAVATFARSHKTAVLTADKSILEASEDIGVNIDYQCRVGTCGICKTNLISGNVTMAVEDALTEDDKTQNIILACQAKATEDVSVDA